MTIIKMTTTMTTRVITMITTTKILAFAVFNLAG